MTAASVSHPWTRRACLTALLALAASGARAAGPPPPLGFQVHALRRFLQQDFDGTLHRMRAIGYTRVEMASFPGFRGDHRGDFGALADLPPEELRARIRAQDLRCDAAHFTPPEITGDRVAAGIDWAHALAVRWMILSGAPTPTHLDELQRWAQQLRAASARLRREGLRLGLHTDQWLWGPLAGQSIVEQLISHVPPEDCALQLDFGGIIEYHLNAVQILAAHPGRFRWLHIRDGRPQADPSVYVPARVPGQGTLDWPAILTAARRSGVVDYVVEMETHSGHEINDYAHAYQAMHHLLG